MPSIALHVDHRQQQGLSPRLQHAVRLLQLSSLDFAQEVRDALGRNPFLEAEESIEDEGPADRPPAEASLDGEQSVYGVDRGVDGGDDGAAPKDPLQESEGDGGERDAWLGDGQSTRRTGDDGGLGVLDTMAEQTSLASHLHGQLDVMPLPPRDRLLAKAVVESLDDDGYLRFDLRDLIEAAGLDPQPSEDELHIALCRVQALEPTGVGARNVAECLRLQLPAITCAEQRALAEQIVDEHLDQLAAKDVPGLARALGCSAAVVEETCDRIRHLDPRPGWRFGSTHAQYVTPDVIVRKVRGEWTASLNPLITPRVRLNKVYAEMFQRHRARHGNASNSELSAHLQEARWTMRNIEQRFATILSVAQEIVKRQVHFFDFGPLAMKPLGLREVAAEVGIHESTVSRVTNNKYMATPLGVFELKYFFSRALVTTSGTACSGTAIRGLIKEMIEGESAEAPLSDAEIARQLARQGLVVARRTVTKYRQLLHLEAVERRRRHA
jgi:RNA polymerase sigma-54 factor